MGFNFKWDNKATAFMRKLSKPKELVNKYIPKATEINAYIIKNEIQKAIDSGAFTPNAALTIAIKGSSHPLKDTGAGLFRAVSVEKIDEAAFFMGILKTDKEYNIALAIHDGCTIKVTDKMRGMFYILWRVSEGREDSGKLTGRAAELYKRMPKGWKPLKSSTTAIIIPARPFIAKAFQNYNTQGTLRRNWEMAIAALFKDLSIP